MKTKYGVAAAALTAFCLLAASVYANPFQGYGLSDPCQGGCFNGPYGGMWVLLVDDATIDDFQNMTLSEIDDLRVQKMQELQNMTLAEIDDLREQKMQEFENMTLAQLNETRQGRMGKMGHGMMVQDMMDQGMMDQDMIGQGRGGHR